jgi:hypothetical protein
MSTDRYRYDRLALFGQGARQARKEIDTRWALLHAEVFGWLA